MTKHKIRLTESQLHNIIGKVLSESQVGTESPNDFEQIYQQVYNARRDLAQIKLKLLKTKNPADNQLLQNCHQIDYLLLQASRLLNNIN